MPRNPRDVSKSGVYHIMLRGINRQAIFEDDEDIQRLLETMSHGGQGDRYLVPVVIFLLFLFLTKQEYVPHIALSHIFR